MSITRILCSVALGLFWQAIGHSLGVVTVGSKALLLFAFAATFAAGSFSGSAETSAEARD